MSNRVNQALLQPEPYASGSTTTTITTTTIPPPSKLENKIIPKNSGITDFVNFGFYITNISDTKYEFNPAGSLQLSKFFNLYNNNNRSDKALPTSSGSFISKTISKTTGSIIKPIPLFQYQRSPIPEFTIDSNFKPEKKNNLK
jgi:hypothetical protein